MNNIAKEIVIAFGGLSKTARALKISSASTIYHWVETGKIPQWRYIQIIEAAEKNHIELPDIFKEGIEG